MFIGHYAASFTAKIASPATPLWVLFLAAQAVDVAWVVLVLSDIEQLRIVEGYTQSNDLDNVYIPYTHGGLLTLVYVLIAAVLYKFVGARIGLKGSAVLVGLVVGSHWLLDLIVHAPDLPLMGDEYKVGAGLWNYVWLAFTLELCLVVGAGYWLASRCGRAAYLFATVLGIMCAINYFGPKPQSVDAVVLGAAAVYVLTIATAYFGERWGWFTQTGRNDKREGERR